MFAPNRSSPMALVGKTKQTSIDLFSRPTTRQTKKAATERGPSAAKPGSKQKDVDDQERSGDPEGACQEDDPSLIGQGLERTTLSAEEGRAYLEEEAFIEPGESADAEVLAGALVQIALMEGMTPKASHAVRSVALMLAQLRSVTVGDSALESMETKVATLVRKATEKMEVAISNMTEVLKAAAQGLTDNTVKLTETTASYKDVLANAAPRRPPGHVAPVHPPALAPRLQAREGVRARQVLIDIDDCTGPEAAALSASSVADLKRRLDKALHGCGDDGAPVPYKARAVTRLKNGGILMELESDEAVEWFAHSDIRKKFAAGLHPEATIKLRNYHVVVQFVPLSFKPDKDDSLWEVEESNGMKTGDIQRARWIKPISRRLPAQTCGHVILLFHSPDTANEALAHGLFICQKKVYAEKCKKEPLRCLKCHGWGHLARDCSAAFDTCGTCAQCHRTDTCKNTARPHCVSCGTVGHASCARACLVFQRKCNKMNDRLEDNNMPYFPTAEPWTQVSEPPKVVYVMPPPPRPAQHSWNNNGMTQSTLPWKTAGAAARGMPPSSQQPPRQARNNNSEHEGPLPTPLPHE